MHLNRELLQLGTRLFFPCLGRSENLSMSNPNSAVRSTSLRNLGIPVSRAIALCCEGNQGVHDARGESFVARFVRCFVHFHSNHFRVHET